MDCEPRILAVLRRWSVKNLTDYVNVELIYDSNRNGMYNFCDRVYRDYGSSSESASIIETLEAGTYFLRVYSDDLRDNSGYTLTLLA